MNNLPAYFITLEGGEGVGKTTNTQFIAQQLTAANIPFITTREPGGTKFAEQIRQLLLSEQTEAPSPLTELLLMFAARSQHLDQLIRPNLAAGTWVICDRFTDASYAYQIKGRGQPAAQLNTLETLVHADLQPHLTFLLDMPVQDSSLRVDQRGIQRDRFEQEEFNFFQRVREGYLERATQFPNRFRVIDASQTLPQVQEQLSQHLQPLITRYLQAKQSA